MSLRGLFSLVLLGPSALLASAQAPTAVLQSVGFNSTFNLSDSQIKSSNLSDTTVKNLNNVVRFQNSQYANGGAVQDSFYGLPPLTNKSGPLAPGTLLKTQAFTNGTPFNIPSNTALSRILYTTTDLNGTVLPASAFVLWPFVPRTFSNSNSSKPTVPVVLWAHGTSSYFPNGAPSTDRNLWYADIVPFTLALAGYAVVAPDYAGLGVGVTWNNKTFPHQYLASPAGAHDMLYAMQASLKAFAGLLDSRFAVLGQSQGGGVAWGVAEVLADHPELGPGYLGSIAVSPTTGVFTGNPLQLVAVPVALAVKSVFPSFELSDWLTPIGVARANLLREVQGGIAAVVQLFPHASSLKPGFQQSWYATAYTKLASAGRKKVKGPLLVISGSQDNVVPFNVTTKSVQDTCQMFPQNDLEYLISNGTGHVPSLDSTRQVWMKWIEDRFEGKSVSKGGCSNTTLYSYLPYDRYKPTDFSFKQWANAPDYEYETPLAL